jgi:uncharacterized protein YrzB (UPF0473 family)
MQIAEGDYDLTVTLDIDGKATECACIATWQAGRQGYDYIALMPITDGKEAAFLYAASSVKKTLSGEREIQIFRYDELPDDEGINIFAIEDDAEFKLAAEVFEKLMAG